MSYMVVESESRPNDPVTQINENADPITNATDCEISAAITGGFDRTRVTTKLEVLRGREINRLTAINGAI